MAGSDDARSNRARPGASYPGLEQLGEFIRAQRKMMELSQRELAKLMEVSDPYISQLERGMHEPSVRVIKALAGALEIRAETLLAYAGLLDEERSSSGVIEAIQADRDLTEDQKSTLVSVYQNFKATSAGAAQAPPEPAPDTNGSTGPATDVEPDGDDA